MGNAHSSQTKDSSKSSRHSKRSKSSSPNQEKHNSADSKAPLTRHIADFATHRASDRDRQSVSTSFGACGRPQSPPEDAIRPTHATNSSPSLRLRSEVPSRVHISPLSGHSNVTRPPLPPRIRRLSELIDPLELNEDSHVRSPSGNLLAPAQFLAHPDRPRSMRERQEEIRERIEGARRLGVEARGADESEKMAGRAQGKVKKEKRSCHSLCCLA